MTRYPSRDQILLLHHRLIDAIGGSHGLRDKGALESCLAQPQMTFGGQELYPTLQEKAASLGFLLIKNHPFLDGNKRIGHAAMELFLSLNGHEIVCDVDEQEHIILALAASEIDQEAFFE